MDEQRYHNGAHPGQSPDQPARVGVYEPAIVYTVTPRLPWFPSPTAQRCSQRIGFSAFEPFGAWRPPSGLSDPPSRRYWLFIHDPKEHILIGNNGQARIANAGYSEIVPTAFTTSETPLSSMALDEFEWRWSAPELQKPGMYGMRRAIATKASDIYGMGMVIYEESPWNRLVLLRCLTPAQVLTREVPFSGYTDRQALVKAQGGDRPRRPANTTSPGITDSIWMLLGQCWYRKPDYRPDSAHVLNIIRHYCLFWEHKPPNPWQIWLKMSNIVTDWKTMRSINPYVTLQYRGSDHTTSRAAAAGRNKYVWCEPSSVPATPLSHERPQGGV